MTTSFVRDGEVPTAEFGDELAVMDLKSGTYVTFNRTAAALWKLIEQPRTLDEICETLAARYRVEPDRCRAEVTDLLDKLQGMKILRQVEI